MRLVLTPCMPAGYGMDCILAGEMGKRCEAVCLLLHVEYDTLFPLARARAD